MEMHSPDVCRVGEIVLIGGKEAKEAKTVVYNGRLVLRLPLERDYPEGGHSASVE